MTNTAFKALIFAGLLGICSPTLALAQQKPQLYPNDKYNKAGVTQANADIGICEGEAGRAVGDSTQSGRTGRKAVGGAAKGAAAGALIGAITKQNVGRSVGAGAAVGGIAGTAQGVRSKGAMNPDYQKYVEACLESKGYKVVGWK